MSATNRVHGSTKSQNNRSPLISWSNGCDPAWSTPPISKIVQILVNILYCPQHFIHLANSSPTSEFELSHLTLWRCWLNESFWTQTVDVPFIKMKMVLSFSSWNIQLRIDHSKFYYYYFLLNCTWASSRATPRIEEFTILLLLIL